MFEEKTFTMRMYNELNNFDNDTKDVDTLTKDGKEKEMQLMYKYGERMKAIKNEAVQEAELNKEMINKITFPNLSSSDKTKQDSAKIDLQNALLFNGQSHYTEHILDTLDVAIANKQYDFVSHVAKKYANKKDEDIKSQKELDLKYAVDDKMKEAFRDTDLEKRYKYKNKLDNELKVLGAYLKELSYGQKKSHQQYMKAVANR